MPAGARDQFEKKNIYKWEQQKKSRENTIERTALWVWLENDHPLQHSFVWLQPELAVEMRCILCCDVSTVTYKALFYQKIKRRTTKMAISIRVTFGRWHESITSGRKSEGLIITPKKCQLISKANFIVFIWIKNRQKYFCISALASKNLYKVVKTKDKTTKGLI